MALNNPDDTVTAFFAVFTSGKTDAQKVTDLMNLFCPNGQNDAQGKPDDSGGGDHAPRTQLCGGSQSHEALDAVFCVIPALFDRAVQT